MELDDLFSSSGKPRLLTREDGEKLAAHCDEIHKRMAIAKRLGIDLSNWTRPASKPRDVFALCTAAAGSTLGALGYLVHDKDEKYPESPRVRQQLLALYDFFYKTALVGIDGTTLQGQIGDVYRFLYNRPHWVPTNVVRQLARTKPLAPEMIAQLKYDIPRTVIFEHDVRPHRSWFDSNDPIVTNYLQYSLFSKDEFIEKVDLRFRGVHWTTSEDGAPIHCIIIVANHVMDGNINPTIAMPHFDLNDSPYLHRLFYNTMGMVEFEEWKDPRSVPIWEELLGLPARKAKDMLREARVRTGIDDGYLIGVRTIALKDLQERARKLDATPTGKRQPQHERGPHWNRYRIGERATWENRPDKWRVHFIPEMTINPDMPRADKIAAKVRTIEDISAGGYRKEFEDRTDPTIEGGLILEPLTL